MAAWENVVKTRVGERSMNHHDWADLWPHLKPVINWLAAGIGLGTAVGVVNLGVGLLSGAWLAVQLYNWFTFTRVKNKLEIEALHEARLHRK